MSWRLTACRLPKDLHREFKIFLAQRELTVQAFLVETITQALRTAPVPREQQREHHDAKT